MVWGAAAARPLYQGAVPDLRSVRKSPLATLFVLALAGLLAGLALASPRAHTQSSLATFRNGFVTFSHPASWPAARVWKEQVPHFDPMVYVGTAAAQHDPCRTATAAARKTIVCGWPIAQLAPNGLFVKWENRDFPGASVAQFPGRLTSVGGRAARIVVSRPGSCGSIGADETISVAVARPVSGSWTQIDACVRGPRLAPLEQQFQTMLGSTRFLAP